MTKRNLTPADPGESGQDSDDRESVPDAFDALYERCLSILSNLQVLVLALNYNNTPNEIHPAVRVLGETTEDADKLLNDLETWHFDHEHTPKAKAVQS